MLLDLQNAFELSEKTFKRVAVHHIVEQGRRGHVLPMVAHIALLNKKAQDFEMPLG